MFQRRVFKKFHNARTTKVRIARHIDIVGAGIFQWQPNEFAAALDRRLIVKLVPHGALPEQFLPPQLHISRKGSTKFAPTGENNFIAWSTTDIVSIVLSFRTKREIFLGSPVLHSLLRATISAPLALQDEAGKRFLIAISELVIVRDSTIYAAGLRNLLTLARMW